jgi:uncharacterized membrane-anchored protein YitT (DUF2179 family)
MSPKSKIDRSKLLTAAKNIGLVIFGSFLLALGDALFIVPSELVTGGVAAVGIIAQHFITASGSDFMAVDIVTGGVSVLLFGVGFFFIGKKFALRSLVATIAYPGFLAILYRLPSIDYLAKALMDIPGEPMLGLFLCGIFGGLLVGLGVAVAYLGNGSTGGLDILCHLLAKHTPIKESVSSFAFDGALIVLGMVLRLEIPNNIPLGFIGITSALITSLAIHVVYVTGNTYVICNIITSKVDETLEFIHVKLDRGSTVYPCLGGFTGTERKMIQAAMAKDEAAALQAFMAEIDPAAFMTFTRSTNINGEGFIPFAQRSKHSIRHKDLLEKKEESQDE